MQAAKPMLEAEICWVKARPCVPVHQRHAIFKECAQIYAQ